MGWLPPAAASAARTGIAIAIETWIETWISTGTVTASACAWTGIHCSVTWIEIWIASVRIPTRCGCGCGTGIQTRCGCGVSRRAFRIASGSGCWIETGMRTWSVVTRKTSTVTVTESGPARAACDCGHACLLVACGRHDL